MIKYTLVEDRWLIDDLEDEFKTTCGSLMRPTESDGFHTELGVGSVMGLFTGWLDRQAKKSRSTERDMLNLSLKLKTQTLK